MCTRERVTQRYQHPHKEHPNKAQREGREKEPELPGTDRLSTKKGRGQGKRSYSCTQNQTTAGAGNPPPHLPCYVGGSGGANVLHDGLNPVAADARRHGREGEFPFLGLGRAEQGSELLNVHQRLPVLPAATQHPVPGLCSATGLFLLPTLALRGSGSRSFAGPGTR